jgi:hypothetical protein
MPPIPEGGDDLREAFEKFIAIGPSSLQRLTIFGRDRRDSGRFWRTLEMSKMVESECDAVVVGRTYLFPPLSSGGALVFRP